MFWGLKENDVCSLLVLLLIQLGWNLIIELGLGLLVCSQKLQVHGKDHIENM